ncbi:MULTISPECIES: DUF6415 family natural product biosynthesis protein [unclassified Streptomyces]|uniref:DUF6415 family natural product biosynthesis protein n=1 Tax=unclassified Streptomyces TaxID=2593676 RepID=UPI001F52377A|nr:DUF6415 family natural product biosynthesis protein [Streptomyces sp. TSRI0107]
MCTAWSPTPTVSVCAGCRCSGCERVRTGPHGPESRPAQLALAGAGEARRRLLEPGAADLKGEVARATRLARSTVALCDHYDALTGAVTCLV